jgi:hypothetical protein
MQPGGVPFVRSVCSHLPYCQSPGFAFRVWRRRRAQGRWFAHLRTVRDLQALAPSGFESAISELLRRQGFRDIELCGRARDVGADIRANHQGRPIIVQCKRYADQVRVDSPAMQRFLGGADGHVLVERANLRIERLGIDQPAAYLNTGCSYGASERL